MKSLGFITLVLIVLSCSGNIKSSKFINSDTLMINNSVYLLDSIGFDEFEAVKTEKFNETEGEVINDSSVHRQDKFNLNFKLNNGQEITYKNDTTDSNYVTYTFIESLKNIDYWLIRMNFYEGGSFLLIDKQNGEKMQIYGKPYFSKNNNWFIAYSFDIEATYDSNGFQLFQIEKGKAKLKWTKDIEDWGPSIVKWSNDSTILIEQSRINNNPDNSRMLLSYKKMKIIK